MNPAEAHFRLAESQYLRMCGSAHYTVARVELIVTPALIRRYEAFKQAQANSGQPTQVWACGFALEFSSSHGGTPRRSILIMNLELIFYF